jgi:hypothetical protein
MDNAVADDTVVHTVFDKHQILHSFGYLLSFLNIFDIPLKSAQDLLLQEGSRRR